MVTRGHLGSYGAIWKISGTSGAIWRRRHILRIRWTKNRNAMLKTPYCFPVILESSNVIWNHFRQSAAIWGNAGPSGAIWCHLKPSGILWGGRATWGHLVPSIWGGVATLAIWNSLGRHPKPSRALWSNRGSALKRQPALVKHFPRRITPCGHLGTAEIIYLGHLGQSGADTTFCESETSHQIKINATLRKTNRRPSILETSGAIWNHLWQLEPPGPMRVHLGPSGAI